MAKILSFLTTLGPVGTLEQLATILKQNKSVKRIRIEGHVHGDGMGAGRYEMSADRARCVVHTANVDCLQL